MKTAISLPDSLFEAADRFAQQKGLSRSELYAQALRAYLLVHAAERVTDALNAVYAEEDSTLDPQLAQAQSGAIGKDEW